MAMHSVKAFLTKFRDDTRGTVAVEAAIVLPMLFWAFLATALFFDMFQTRSTTEKAAFTVSDLLSRETVAIDDTYLESMYDLFQSISKLDDVNGMRVSVITWDSVNAKYTLDWSEGVGGNGVLGLTETQLAGLADNLPDLVGGERLIVVQSWGKYDPPINVGLGVVDMDTFVFTRPRFAPLLAWAETTPTS